MGDSLEPPDFLAAALRQSRTALADAGFSDRVARRVRAHRRRMKVARALPAVMALLGVALASAFTSFTAIKIGSQWPAWISAMENAAGASAPIFGVFSHYGLPPWMLIAGIGAAIYALVFTSRDARTAFRF